MEAITIELIAYSILFVVLYIIGELGLIFKHKFYYIIPLDRIETFEDFLENNFILFMLNAILTGIVIGIGELIYNIHLYYKGLLIFLTVATIIIIAGYLKIKAYEIYKNNFINKKEKNKNGKNIHRKIQTKRI